MFSDSLKIRETIEELSLLGFKGSLYRIYRELSVSSGMVSVINPIIHNLKKKHDFITRQCWQKMRPTFFIPNVNNNDFQYTFNKYYPEDEKSKLLKHANQLFAGQIHCFSRWIGDYKVPIDWHRNPIKKVSWPSDVHSSMIMSFEKEFGDIKLTWEINRFPHVYTLARAYILTGDSVWVSVFCEQLRLWEKANPYMAGVNWSSGQELAIRALAEIFALYVFGDDDAFSEDDFQRVQRLLYWHAEHIDRNINYARYAVHNNHLIGEALGLYAIGSLFPWFDKADKWERKGRKLLEYDCLRQFKADGGYCQSSHNYHRLALHYYLWACRLGECLNERFPPSVYEIVGRSGEYLASFMNEDGCLPNWGANDGALLNPWTSCDYSDFRPVLTAIRYLTKGVKAFEDGPWDEELLWFHGTEALNSDIERYPLKSETFPISGLHVLRENEQTFIVFRCGSVIDRFGQADQLHTDIWWKGLNIAIDGGSYLYNDELQYHRYFMGTRSHNTVIAGQEDQMHLHRRFKWLYWTKARLLSFEPNKMLEGEHYGYQRLKGNVRHRRNVAMLKKGCFLIKDIVTQKNPHHHAYILHWLISDYEYRILNKSRNMMLIEFMTSRGKYYLYIRSERQAQFKIKRAVDNECPDGWHSRYYGEKLPALSIHTHCSSDNGVGFVSIFSDDRQLIG